jgi:hypothetical protein
LFIISKLLDKFLLGPKSFVSDFVEALEKKKKKKNFIQVPIYQDKKQYKYKMIEGKRKKKKLTKIKVK